MKRIKAKRARSSRKRKKMRERENKMVNEKKLFGNKRESMVF